MKKLIVFLLISIAISCSDDAVKPAPNDFLGFWVPYEIDGPDGISTGPFASMSIFGFYAESILFNADGTYYPSVWLDEENFWSFEDRGGKYAYTKSVDTIFLTEGQWDMELKVIKHSTDELWLKSEDTTYKLHLWSE